MAALPNTEDCNVKVVVRVRPMNDREAASKPCIQMAEGRQTVLRGLGHPEKKFTFDHSCDSSNATDASFVSQEKFFELVGVPLMEEIMKGFNCTVFAYGQTGSGKTYTMTGDPDNQGFIPRLCNAIFERAKVTHHEVNVAASLLQIYNEKITDLLDEEHKGQELHLREHPVTGPYVEGLSRYKVSSEGEVASMINRGMKGRATTATNMNSVSSRSHAVCIIRIEQAEIEADGTRNVKTSIINLVDLAGSERVKKSGVTGQAMEEAVGINASLSALGRVIMELADGKRFIPYRDSTLTWLLKESLGGNAKTVMVATVSPSEKNYDESLSTLRYANKAKRIVNAANVNEDPTLALIRELRAELEKLKSGTAYADLSKEKDQWMAEKRDLVQENRSLAQRLRCAEEDAQMGHNEGGTGRGDGASAPVAGISSAGLNEERAKHAAQIKKCKQIMGAQKEKLAEAAEANKRLKAMLVKMKNNPGSPAASPRRGSSANSPRAGASPRPKLATSAEQGAPSLTTTPSSPGTSRRASSPHITHSASTKNVRRGSRNSPGLSPSYMASEPAIRKARGNVGDLIRKMSSVPTLHAGGLSGGAVTEADMLGGQPLETDQLFDVIINNVSDMDDLGAATPKGKAQMEQFIADLTAVKEFHKQQAAMHKRNTEVMAQEISKLYEENKRLKQDNSRVRANFGRLSAEQIEEEGDYGPSFEDTFEMGF